MKFCLLFIALSGLSVLGLAQNYQEEINKQVWEPFIRAQVEVDEETYLKIHSAQVIRAEITNKKIYGFDTYAQTIHEGFERARLAKEKGSKVELSVELRFLNRLASDNLAYEVGYYKSKLKFENGKEVTYYSQFRVSLRKENGLWKILTDSSLPLPDLTEEVFLTAHSMKS